MFQESLTAIASTSAKKVALLDGSPARYLTLSMLAGSYVGFGVALIFAIGAPLAAAQSPLVKVIMGASFGVASIFGPAAGGLKAFL